MAEIRVARVGGGKDTGKLRVTVTYTLSPHDELSVARAFDVHDETRANLDLPSRERGIGPCGHDIGAAMNNAVVDLIAEGRAKGLKK
jgi:hypothetical protein